MKTLLMLQGPPASGKTSFAMTVLEGLGALRCRRINQDDIRRELGLTEWSQWDFKGPAEQQVYVIKRQRIEAALLDPNVTMVISDDTNLKMARKIELEALAAEHGAALEIKRFDTSLEECLRRDKLREHSVGEKVIRRMHAEMLGSIPAKPRALPSFEPRKVEHIAGLRDVIICDLDGTLADHEGRRGVYDFAKCDEDALKTPIAAIVEQFWHGAPARPHIVFMSGREEKFRPQTVRFLEKHRLYAGPLYMRPTGDKRNDAIVKTELFDQHIRGQFNVLFCLDDRDRVVNMWRAMGLCCLQVAPGAF